MELPKRMSGAQLFFECLRQENVEYLFGYPGGAVLPIYDLLYDIKDIFHVLVRHEQGATHMAEGYAKATGRPGVVLVTSGPGATNTVTGIADAFMDSIPLVVFTGQVPRAMLGIDSFQEADVIGITRPITKWNKIIRSADEICEVIPKAFDIACSGRPGPVLIDIPKDVAMEMGTWKPKRKISSPSLMNSNQSSLEMVAKSLKRFKRPLIYYGGGVIQSNAYKELIEFAQKTNIPVTSTLQGLGGFPGNHKLFLGMLGMHGTYAANMSIDHCDLLLVLGARFDDRVTGKVSKFSQGSFKIHFEIDPSNINKSVHVDLQIVGDLKEELKKLIPLVKEVPDLEEWKTTIQNWQKSTPLTIPKSELTPQLILSKLSDVTNGNAIICTDVGQNQMWSAQYFKFQKPRTHITSGGLGTMGFSVPASIGAAFGRKDLPIISISGDGGFQMNMQELITAFYYKLPIKFIIFNNSTLGMVRQWQELFHKERFSYTNLEGANPNFVNLSQSMGIPSKRISKKEDLDKSLGWLFEEGPRLIEFIIPQGEMVFPIIPSGSSVKEIITQRFSKEEK